MIPGTFWILRSSGKFDTWCERMQRAKVSVSCWAWAWFGLAWPPELDKPGELEPHAVIAIAAAIVAAVRAAAGHACRGRRTTHMGSFTMFSSGDRSWLLLSRRPEERSSASWLLGSRWPQPAAVRRAIVAGGGPEVGGPSGPLVARLPIGERGFCQSEPKRDRRPQLVPDVSGEPRVEGARVGRRAGECADRHLGHRG